MINKGSPDISQGTFELGLLPIWINYSVLSRICFQASLPVEMIYLKFYAGSDRGCVFLLEIHFLLIAGVSFIAINRNLLKPTLSNLDLYRAQGEKKCG